MQQTFGCPKSMAGAGLIAAGIFTFYENLNGAASQLSHLFDVIPRQALGLVPAVIVAAPRVLQAFAADHQFFLLSLCRYMFVLCWPLLLVVAGTVLAPDIFTDDINPFTRKNCGLVELATRRSTSK